jgi:hypothetical protein
VRNGATGVLRIFVASWICFAAASVADADVIVSWNFRHIVNVIKIKEFNSVNLREGYKIIDIRSPRELIYEEDLIVFK